MSKQNNCCAICGKSQNNENRRFAIDHCHKTGKIRGLLCYTCNNGLGSFKDNVIFLLNAINYLK